MTHEIEQDGEVEDIEERLDDATDFSSHRSSAIEVGSRDPNKEFERMRRAKARSR